MMPNSHESAIMESSRQGYSALARIASLLAIGLVGTQAAVLTQTSLARGNGKDQNGEPGGQTIDTCTDPQQNGEPVEQTIDTCSDPDLADPQEENLKIAQFTQRNGSKVSNRNVYLQILEHLNLDISELKNMNILFGRYGGKFIDQYVEPGHQFDMHKLKRQLEDLGVNVEKELKKWEKEPDYKKDPVTFLKMQLERAELEREIYRIGEGKYPYEINLGNNRFLMAHGYNRIQVFTRVGVSTSNRRVPNATEVKDALTILSVSQHVEEEDFLGAKEIAKDNPQLVKHLSMQCMNKNGIHPEMYSKSSILGNVLEVSIRKSMDDLVELTIFGQKLLLQWGSVWLGLVDGTLMYPLAEDGTYMFDGTAWQRSDGANLAEGDTEALLSYVELDQRMKDWMVQPDWIKHVEQLGIKNHVDWRKKLHNQQYPHMQQQHLKTIVEPYLMQQQQLKTVRKFDFDFEAYNELFLANLVDTKRWHQAVEFIAATIYQVQRQPILGINQGRVVKRLLISGQIDEFLQVVRTSIGNSEDCPIKLVMKNFEKICDLRREIQAGVHSGVSIFDQLLGVNGRIQNLWPGLAQVDWIYEGAFRMPLKKSSGRTIDGHRVFWEGTDDDSEEILKYTYKMLYNPEITSAEKLKEGSISWPEHLENNTSHKETWQCIWRVIWELKREAEQKKA